MLMQAAQHHSFCCWKACLNVIEEIPVVQTSTGCSPIGVIVCTGVSHCFAPNIVRETAKKLAPARAVRRKARRSILNLEISRGENIPGGQTQNTPHQAKSFHAKSFQACQAQPRKPTLPDFGIMNTWQSKRRYRR